MRTQERINKQGQDYIAGLQNTVKRLWVSMCEEDNIPPDSQFVEFNPNNKFTPFYHAAMAQLQEARSQYRAGGYVGLTI
jgi:hypothetical protein